MSVPTLSAVIFGAEGPHFVVVVGHDQAIFFMAQSKRLDVEAVVEYQSGCVGGQAIVGRAETYLQYFGSLAWLIVLLRDLSLALEHVPEHEKLALVA